jgi:hypothetical protein
MTKHLIETIRHNLGYADLQKINPVDQEPKQPAPQAPEELLSQAAIPAVATALYSFTRNQDGCEALLRGTNSDWLGTIYKGREKEAISKVSQYAGVTDSQAESHMEDIADEAVKHLRSIAGNPAEATKISAYMSSERHNILTHLPAAMQLGDLLNDDSLDDRTNKMEGPMSNMMHKIESTFSEGEKKS